MATKNETLSAHMQAKLSPEKIERMRQRLGICFHRTTRPVPASFKNTVSSEDSIRRFVHSYGDDNPLFIDPEYARHSRWGEITAPFEYLYTITQPDPEQPALTPEQEEIMSGGDPLRGIHEFVSGSTSEWWRPITIGRRFYEQSANVGLIEKQSQFAQRALHRFNATVMRNDLHELIGAKTKLRIHTSATRPPSRENTRTSSARITPRRTFRPSTRRTRTSSVGVPRSSGGRMSRLAKRCRRWSKDR
jgi:hypothetical protein